jgi:hypothetical protein
MMTGHGSRADVMDLDGFIRLIMVLWTAGDMDNALLLLVSDMEYGWL